MLTSKSNFNTLRELKGKKITEEALQQLYNNCISKDFINLNGNISKGYPAEIANFIMQKIDATKADKIKILVFNDLSFHMYNCLTNAGILSKNITLAFGKWNKDGTPLNDKKVYTIMSMFAKSNFVEFERDASNIVTLEEIMNMNMKNNINVNVNGNIKFDYIISNPPYAIGNAITKSVVDNVNFDNFINLMPASKYKSQQLYKNVIKVESVEDFFDDAAVGDSLTICLLDKSDGPYITYDDFENEKRDPQYREFYKLNAKINHYAISSFNNTTKRFNDNKDWDAKKSFAITLRTVQNGVHKLDGPGAFDIDFNIYKTKTFEDVHIGTYYKGKGQPTDLGIPTTCFIYFKTEQEHRNLCRFWYYNSLMNDLIKGLNKSSGTCSAAIPNIDYSIDRDYEHLTLDDIMKILKEENNL